MYYKKTQSWLKHLDFIILDMICLQVAFVLAYMTRHGLVSPYANPKYFNLAIVYLMVDLLVLITNRTMKNVLKRGYYKEIAQTVRHVALVAALVSIYMFSVQKGEDYSRITFYLLAIYYTIISYLVRISWKKYILRKIKGNVNAAIFFVTTAERAERIVSRYRKNAIIARHIQGVCLLDEDRTGETIGDVQICASKDTVLQYLREIWVDEVFISLPKNYPNPAELIAAIADMGIVTHVEMEELDVEQWQHQTIQKIAGTTVRTVSMTMATPMQAAMKRTLDILGGLVGCAITCLLTLILGPVIYISSPGPIFFAQTRVGKNGKKFKMYKFRSMYLDAEMRKAELMAQNRVQGGLMFKLDYDPRIIGCKKLPDGTVKKGIGNFIRDWSLDEFPQFFNVLKGDLSLCGTRPPTVDEWEKYELHHRARLAIKPGITGLWQISGRSNITDFEQVVELDKKYIREWSMGLDLRILFKTVQAVLGRKGSM